MNTVESMGVRDQVQSMGYRAWENKERKGTVVMATGVGKSKLAVRRVKELASGPELLSGYIDRPPVLLVTPTEKLRDENWPDEFKKWDAHKEMVHLVKRICFASLKNEKGNRYKLVILDEIHRLTEYNAEGFQGDGDGLIRFFADNMAEEVLGLTATEPDQKRDKMKWQIIHQVAPVVFRYGVEEAVRDGVVSDFTIKMILCPLENVRKEIKGGSKAKPFMQTEIAAYEYIEKKVRQARALAKSSPAKEGWATIMTMKRNQFIYNLPSKTRIAKELLRRVLPGKKTLVFCGSIAQSRELCGENVFNSSPEDKNRGMLTRFKQGEIDYLGVVNAVNEGHNIPDMDQAVIVQLNSNERDIIQRIGRIIRFRPGHHAMIYIIVTQQTADQKWADKALDGFDPKRIEYESYLKYVV